MAAAKCASRRAVKNRDLARPDIYTRDFAQQLQVQTQYIHLPNSCHDWVAPVPNEVEFHVLAT